MTLDAGVLRDGVRLERAAKELADMDSDDPEVRNLVTVGSALVEAATDRTESRGTHRRVDHPATDPGFLGRTVFSGADRAPRFVRLSHTVAPA